MIKKLIVVVMSIVFFILIFVIFIPFKTCLNAHLNGSWYEGTAATLTAQLSKMNDEARCHYDMQINRAQIYALVVPHAGYIYSGALAAAAYRLVDSIVVDRVVVLAPVHDGTVVGIAVPTFDCYEIPTGTITIDRATVKDLLNKSFFKHNVAVFEREHSFEIQLPLIHHYFPHAQVVPLLVGHISVADIPQITQVLRSLIVERTLFIISSDMTHYGLRYGYTPFTDNIVERTRYIDGQVMHALVNHDMAYLVNLEHSSSGLSVCGINPIKLLIDLIDGGAFGTVSTRLVGYGSSNSASNFSDGRVTYASYIVMQETIQDTLSRYDKTALLAYARDTIKGAFEETNIKNMALLQPLVTKPMRSKNGVFVTLYITHGAEKELRGFIGRLASDTPLIDLVRLMALEAAFNDNRFLPLTREELDLVTIEISVLQPPYSVASYKDIVLGTHGIILTVPDTDATKGGQALFLPKVPQEFNMNTIEETLMQLSKKAGLPMNAWQLPNAQFQVFKSIDFTE